MDTSELLALLLGLATLLPLASFFVILALGPRFPKPVHGAYIATGAIVVAGVLSFTSLAIWLSHHYPEVAHHGAADTHDDPHHDDGEQAAPHNDTQPPAGNGNGSDEKHASGDASSDAGDPRHGDESQAAAHGHGPDHKPQYTGDYYLLGEFGRLRLTISYYIDTLTVCMFCMVTLIASCIHFYAMGYMHDEEHDVTDHEVTLSDGSHLTRRGRFYRFFQYMSLFCFSMLGLVLAGNILMVFVFWELVGICSYFLIGFYVERKSASNAANKAFIVNRVGDFGFIIGLMALWSSLGTFAFGDIDYNGNGSVEVTERGIFNQVRPPEKHHQLTVPDGMMLESARDEVGPIVRQLGPDASRQEIQAAIMQRAESEGWRRHGPDGSRAPYGYWLLIVAGIGIFCGCVGKSAQFPLHVWLPDAMEGPTPVSALVHSATMVAAGVYLVARFFPVFTPEVLLVIAITGTITLLLAATIAVTATDIKRVLAYSTVSQLGYMMLALGVGGWVAGVMHLITHAFFKSLLFLCSGSVIHAVHTNEMTEMGGLRKKMPITAYTMLVGCLAIAGISIPFVIGFSGYYSKDRILEQAYTFMGQNNSGLATFFFAAAAGGAAITAFYMFRLWYLTFAGKPRDQHRYDHAHESPRVMTVPLIVLAVFATGVAWQLPSFMPFSAVSLEGLLEQSRPLGTLVDARGPLTAQVWPNEHFAHEPAQFWTIVFPVTMLATCTALGGIALATVMYLLGYLDPDEVRRQFPPVYRLLRNKWWFDELYDFLFVKPTHVISRVAANIDRRWIDGFVDGTARVTRRFAVTWDYVADRSLVDGLVNLAAGWIWSIGVWFRVLQTGKLRQYVMFIVIGAMAIFVLLSFFWTPTQAN